MDRKKIIVILSIIIIGGISGGAYWYFTKKTPLSPGGQFPGESTTRPKDTTTEPTTGEEEVEPIFTPEKGGVLPRLYELHKVPVAGVGFMETKDKKGIITAISSRYIERGLGHIFETPLATYKESRIVNETRPRISEALWGNNGGSVVIRFINDKTGGTIETRIINIATPSISFTQGTSTESNLGDFLKTEEVFLPYNIPFMATAEDGADQVFYLENGTNVSAGSVSTFKNSSISKIFSSSFTEWLPQFPNKNIVTFTTKPSATVAGHLFFVDVKTKVLTKILGGQKGLTTLTSHDGKFVLYAETKGDRPELSIYDVTKKTSKQLYLQTLPEKCVWGIKNISIVYCAIPQGLQTAQYPDQWYQGLVSFTDDIWRIDTKTAIAERVFTGSFDIINPVLSSDEKYILFMNKVTGTPWVYRLAPEVPPTPVTPPAQTGTSTMQTTSVSPSPIEGMTRIR